LREGELLWDEMYVENRKIEKKKERKKTKKKKKKEKKKARRNYRNITYTFRQIGDLLREGELLWDEMYVDAIEHVLNSRHCYPQG
jgi:hypothetical protein